MKQRVSEAYSESSQTSEMELFVILGFRLCFEYASGFRCKQSLFWRGTDNVHGKLTKNKSVTEWYKWGKCE